MSTDLGGVAAVEGQPWEAVAQRLSIIVDLDEDEMAQLAEVSIPARTYTPGQNVFEEGESQDAVYLCMDGWGARYRILPDGQRQVVDLILPGSLFGATSNPYGEYIHSAEALKDLSVAVINTDALRALSGSSPRVAGALAICLGEEATRLSERVVTLGRRDAFERLAHFFLEVRHRLHWRKSEDVVHVRVPIPQQEMADFLGLTSVHVSRTMRKMADQGVIAYDDEYVDILDDAALMEACDFDAERLEASLIPDPVRKALLGRD